MVLAVAFCVGASVGDNAWADEGSQSNLIDFLAARRDLSSEARRAWVRETKKRFGGAALDEESKTRIEIGVAKAIIASAIFMQVSPKRGVAAAWDGWHGALGYVPPPIAIEYQILALQGRKPRGRPIDLAFNFPAFYSEEIAPDVVAFWEAGLKDGTIPEAARRETIEALEATRVKMRPLLVDKLRLIAVLVRERAVLSDGHSGRARRAEIDENLSALEAELRQSFQGVAARPEVLDPARTPFERLRIQLKAMGLSPTPEDLDPRMRPEGAGPERAERAERVETSVPVVEARYDAQLRRTIKPWLGTPYRFGGASRGTGTDCSGFSKGVVSEGFSVNLPRVSRDQFRMGTKVERGDLRPGDLVFFDTVDGGRVNHVGIYQGKGTFAHASSSQGVVYADLGARYFRHAYRGARRVLWYPIED